MSWCGNDAAMLTAIAGLVAESAGLHRALGLAADDVALAQTATQKSALRLGLSSELSLHASTHLSPERDPSTEYLEILECLVRGEVATALQRVERFDADILGSIERCLARDQLSAETVSVLRLVEPILHQVTGQEEGAPLRSARQ